MTTYNGSALIGQSIESILSQTFTDFEFIIVDDCSTDNTTDIISNYDDPRIHLIRNNTNLGVAAARNRAFAAARGTYLALMDHDDLSFPTRLARQVAHLDAHPNIVGLGTLSETLRFGQVERASRFPARSTAVLIDWMLHLVNPLVQSSMMLRCAAVRQLDCFMRPAFKYADDFDLYHRLKAIGDIERLDTCLTIYRLHGENASYRFEDLMIVNAAKVLDSALRPWLGDDSADAATLVASLVSAQKPAADLASLRRLGDYLLRMLDAFSADHRPSAADEREICRYAGLVWWQVIRQTALAGRPDALLLHRRSRRLAGFYRPTLREWLFCAPKSLLSTLRHRLTRTPGHALPKPQAAPAVAIEPLFDNRAEPADLDRNRPPTLFVVVDTEAEFDWSKPLDRCQTGVTNLALQVKAQEIFDRYGLRPIYLIDYPVASQRDSYEVLRELLARNACEVGVHLHPWTTPPFAESLSDWNSYPGNLSADLEERKLVSLLDMIRQTLGVEPLYYKAGRNGLGPNSLNILLRHGLTVDLSLLPATDRTKEGGPDTRRLKATGYRVANAAILALPITRAFLGPLESWGRILAPLLTSFVGRKLRLRGVLSRCCLLNQVTLTPEGIDADEQISLIKALYRRGHRIFVMSYHSSSLKVGGTPYVRDQGELELFLDRIDRVCRYFFDGLGGLPGQLKYLAPPPAQRAPPPRRADNGAATARPAAAATADPRTRWARDTVSVIIAAYNAETTIEQTLQSVLLQSRPPLEIIVVSDGSIDGTCAIVERFAPAVSLLRKTNGGPASARNLAARHASGRWLACLDADDLWNPRKIERQLASVIAETVGVVHCLSNISPANVPSRITFDDLWWRNWIVHSTTLIRRSAFDAVGGYDESLGMAEDYNLWLRLSAAGYDILTIPEKLAYYRKNHGLTKNTGLLYQWELLNLRKIAAICDVSPVKLNTRIIAMNEHYGFAALHDRKMSVAQGIFRDSFMRRPTMKTSLLLLLAHMPPVLMDVKRRIANPW